MLKGLGGLPKKFKHFQSIFLCCLPWKEFYRWAKYPGVGVRSLPKNLEPFKKDFFMFGLTFGAYYAIYNFGRPKILRCLPFCCIGQHVAISHKRVQLSGSGAYSPYWLWPESDLFLPLSPSNISGSTLHLPNPHCFLGKFGEICKFCSKSPPGGWGQGLVGNW